jgi:electron transfer flavoprotein beta subunit
MNLFSSFKEVSLLMNIIVCVKQVNDPEAPFSNFKIDEATNKIIPPPGVAQVISVFDEYAVEAALRIKDKLGGKVIVLSMGTNFHRDIIKKPLAMGADQLILLDSPEFIDGDNWSTAYALSLAIKKIGQFDLILCGRQAADSDSGQVGSGIAEILGIPSVTIARKVEIEGNKVKIERVIPDGYELIEAGLPILITIGNEHAAPRYPNVKGIMVSKRIEPIIWKPADIGADLSKIGANGRRSRLMKLYKPTRDTKCEIVTADTPEEAGDKLATRLKEANLI